jgi:hypothetical protein
MCRSPSLRLARSLLGSPLTPHEWYDNLCFYLVGLRQPRIWLRHSERENHHDDPRSGSLTGQATSCLTLVRVSGLTGRLTSRLAHVCPSFGVFSRCSARGYEPPTKRALSPLEVRGGLKLERRILPRCGTIVVG